MIPITIGKVPARLGWEQRLAGVTRGMIAGLRRNPRTRDPKVIRRKLIEAMREVLTGRLDEGWFVDASDDVHVATPGVFLTLVVDAGLEFRDPVAAETIMGELQKVLDRELPR